MSRYNSILPARTNVTQIFRAQTVVDLTTQIKWLLQLVVQTKVDKTVKPWWKCLTHFNQCGRDCAQHQVVTYQPLQVYRVEPKCNIKEKYCKILAERNVVVSFVTQSEYLFVCTHGSRCTCVTGTGAVAIVRTPLGFSSLHLAIVPSFVTMFRLDRSLHFHSPTWCSWTAHLAKFSLLNQHSKCQIRVGDTSQSKFNF